MVQRGPLYAGAPPKGRPEGRYLTALAHCAHPSTMRMLYVGRGGGLGALTVSVMGCGGPQGISNSSPVARRAPLRSPPLPPGPRARARACSLKPLDSIIWLFDCDPIAVRLLFDCYSIAIRLRYDCDTIAIRLLIKLPRVQHPEGAGSIVYFVTSSGQRS